MDLWPSRDHQNMSQNLEGKLENKNLIILWQPFLSLPLHLFLVLWFYFSVYHARSPGTV